MIDMNNINSLALAYLGDAIYEVYVREYLIAKGITKVNNLQKESVKYVSAKGQAKYIKYMIDNSFLTEEEMTIFTRARNHKSHNAPKNTDIITYKQATGLEALIGYLHINKKSERIEEIMNYILSLEGCK